MKRIHVVEVHAPAQVASCNDAYVQLVAEALAGVSPEVRNAAVRTLLQSIKCGGGAANASAEEKE